MQQNKNPITSAITAKRWRTSAVARVRRRDGTESTDARNKATTRAGRRRRGREANASDAGATMKHTASPLGTRSHSRRGPNLPLRVSQLREGAPVLANRPIRRRRTFAVAEGSLASEDVGQREST